MTSKLARGLAIASAILTLLCIIAWLTDGAPHTPALDPLSGTGDNSYLGHQRFTLGNWLIWAIGSKLRWAGYGQLAIIAATVASAALLSLLTLLRGGQTTAIRYLGTGLGWWSLSICYLNFITVVPTFEAFDSIDKYLRVGCDAIAFQLLLASCYAFINFWRTFPRPVSNDELNSFLDKQVREQYDFMSPARNAIYRFTQRRNHEALTDTDLAAKPGFRIDRYTKRIPTSVWVIVVIALVFISSLGWRLGVFPNDHFMAEAFVCYIVLFYAPGFQCTRLFKFHRVVGNAEDRRRIEWIWAALWIAIVLILIPAVVTPIWKLAEYWLPEYPVSYSAVTIYLIFALTSGPLILIMALAISILYRGNIDPRLALRGFTVWTLLSVVLTLIFVFVERSVALRLVRWWDLPSQTSFVTAGAMVAATFQPIRKRVEKNVNRFVERVMPTTLLASGKRQTVAVVVADISGYTALSAKDEQASLLASALLQKEARRVTESTGGRVVKSTGDGVILCFLEPQRALDAVKELYRAVKAGAETLGLAGLKLHSGLHWGEVVEMHDGDIYGLTVNVTARIADWAAAGEIGVSDVFHRELRSPSGFEAAGPQAFKNVPQPVPCLKLAGI